MSHSQRREPLMLRLHRLDRRLDRRLGDRAAGADDGFMLLEAMITITLITIIMAALASFFITAVSSTAQQRARQMAAQVDTTVVSNLRNQHASDLATTATASFSNVPVSIQPWLSGMDAATATTAVPTNPQSQTINNVRYSIYRYLGWCWISTDSSTECGNNPRTGVKYLRAVIASTWTDTHCANSTCAYISATLLSTADDPTFNINQSPPPVPIITTVPDQNSWAVGDQVSLQLGVQNGTGVPLFTWGYNTLPTGLSMNSAGLVTGTPSIAGTTTTTATVTDAFLRNDTDTFVWNLLPRLTVGTVSTAGTVGTAYTYTLSASGGSGSGYTWSDPTGSLPPGLSVSSSTGKITGTPTTAGLYSVTLKVADSTVTRTATTTFAFNVAYPPITAGNPGPQTATINTSVSPAIALAASGGSNNVSNYRWTGSNFPAGVSISSAGVISGTPSATGTKTASVTVTDVVSSQTNTTTFSFAVVAKPTITTPVVSDTSVGAAVTKSVASTCPNSPCSYDSDGLPSGLIVSPTTGAITGTVSGNAQSYTGITITVTDADGATATTNSFSWTVRAKPTVTAPANQVDTIGRPISVSLATSCALSPCSYTLNGGPATLSISTGGVISGTITSTAQTFSTVSVTVTDAVGSAATTTNFTWTIKAKPTVTSPGAMTTSVGGTINKTLTNSCPNSPCLFAFSAAAPDGPTISTAGVISGTITDTAGTYAGITITVTDADGSTATTAAFTWTIKAAPTIANPQTIPGTGYPTGIARNATYQATLAYTCAAVSCTITLDSAPTGIGLDTNTAGTVSTSVVVSTTSGTIYLRGTVSSSNTTGNKTVSVTIADTYSSTDNGSAVWKVT